MASRFDHSKENGDEFRRMMILVDGIDVGLLVIMQTEMVCIIMRL
jgi:hypothetical protein